IPGQAGTTGAQVRRKTLIQKNQDRCISSITKECNPHSVQQKRRKILRQRHVREKYRQQNNSRNTDNEKGQLTPNKITDKTRKQRGKKSADTSRDQNR